MKSRISELVRYDRGEMLQVLCAHDWCRCVQFEVVGSLCNAPDACVINWRCHVLVQFAEKLGDVVILNIVGMQLLPHTASK